jgi:hypothetical protein
LARVEKDTGRVLEPRVMMLGSLEQVASALPSAAPRPEPAVPGSSREHPMFFGDGLFGVYHPGRRPSAVLLCPAIGHEYLRSHRAMRQLAARLARVGWHVLRFDYTGEGDSIDGEARWAADIEAAAAELRRLSGARELAAVGLRLGAAFAYRAAPALGVSRLVLWDPVCRGAVYLEELGARPRQARRDELLGAPMPAPRRDAIAAIDLSSCEPVSQVTVVASQADREHRRLIERLRRTGGEAALHVVEGAGGNWDALTDLEKTLQPGPLLQTIVEALGKP